MEVGPLLVHAKPIAEPQVATTKPERGLKHGISVGAMGDPKNGPIFLTAVNEDLTEHQEGEVSLPDAWVSGKRGVYDLYGLKKVAGAGARAFPVEALDSGDGRVYLLGAESQFQTARRQVLSNRITEILRVQNADRIIAKRWKLDLSKYDATVKHISKLVDTGKYSQALDACADAAESIRTVMDRDTELVACRTALNAAQKDLGRINRGVYEGSYMVRPGQEDNEKPFKNLCKRYSDLRVEYFRGRKADLSRRANELLSDVKALLAKCTHS
jgi:hypothetical protein